MSIVNDEPLMDREDGRNLYQESDKLLRLAEGLQDKCELYERRWWLLIAMCTSMLMVCVIGALFFIFRAVQAGPVDLADNMWLWAALLAFFYSVAVGIYLNYMRAKLDRQLARERRALHGIVDLLRDLEKGVAEKDNLSTLERAEFRIRLSRFDIGPGG